MRSLHRVFFCLAFPGGLISGAGCGFPDATFTDGVSPAGAGGAGASSATESASTAAASSDATGSGGGATDAGGNGSGSAGTGGGATGTGGGGGATTSSASAGSTASGSGGDGGATTSSAGAGSAASGSGSGGGPATSSASASSTASGAGGGAVDCDVDKDHYRSIACEGGNDCNDDNPLVHPGQPSVFYDTPIATGGGFDYDCSGKEEREFRAVDCSGLLTCAAASNVFLADVPCGGRGPFGTCGLTCQSDITFPDYIRACH